MVNLLKRPQDYTRLRRQKSLFLLFLLFLLILVAFCAINAGSLHYSLGEVCRALFHPDGSQASTVIWQMRLPRVAAGIFAGAGLALAGCILQNNLHNPLASPSTLGIANGAAFGANVAIILLGAGHVLTSGTAQVQITNPYSVTLCAFLAAMATTLLIFLLARGRRFSSESIVLAGVALSSLFSAGTMLLQYFAADPAKVAAVVFWTFGDLGRASWREIGVLGLLTIFAFLFFYRYRWQYNALDSGEETAKSLGIQVEKLCLSGMLIASLVTAVAVSFLGIIGFIGLVAPQMAKRIIGEDKRYLIPASALLGATLLLFADVLSRIVLAPQTLPVGAITAFLGAPLFLYLLLRGRPR